MRFRSLLFSGALAFVVSSIAHIAVVGQTDLQGDWMNKSATPLERPAQLEGRQFLTEAQVAELKKRAARRDSRA